MAVPVAPGREPDPPKDAYRTEPGPLSEQTLAEMKLGAEIVARHAAEKTRIRAQADQALADKVANGAPPEQGDLFFKED